MNTAGAEAAFAEAEQLRSEQREDANLKAIEKYREAAATFQSNNDLKRATIALRNAGEILQLLGNSVEALVCYQQAQALSRKTKDQKIEDQKIEDQKIVSEYRKILRSMHRGGRFRPPKDLSKARKRNAVCRNAGGSDTTTTRGKRSFLPQSSQRPSHSARQSQSPNGPAH